MITFLYSSPLHLHVILIHIIQPTIHKALRTTRKVKNDYSIWEQPIIILLCISGKAKALFEEQPFDIISKVKI